MSDNFRFDPYTGDPIPDEPEVNNIPETTGPVQDQTIQAESSYNVTQPNAYENSAPNNAQEPGYMSQETNTPQETGYMPQDANTPQETGYMPQDANTYIPQNTVSPQSGTYTNQESQFNPYTGQPLNASNNIEQLNRKASKLGTAALIVGICSIVFSFCTMCCCPLLSIGLGIAGIICGVKAKDANGDRLGTGTAGLITSIIGLVITVFFLILMLIYMSTPQFQEDFKKGFQEGLKQYQTQNGDTPFGNDNGYNNYNNDMYNNDGFFSN